MSNEHDAYIYWIGWIPCRSLQWRHNGHDGVSNHQPHDCLLNRLFRNRSKKTSKPRITGICAGNSPVTGEFHAPRASNAENVSIWWRHHIQNNLTISFSNCIWLGFIYIKQHFWTPAHVNSGGFMMTSSNGNIFRVTGHLCGEFTGPRWIPHTKASDAELWCFLWSASDKPLSKHSRGWWFETLSRSFWRHYNVMWWMQMPWRQRPWNLQPLYWLHCILAFSIMKLSSTNPNGWQLKVPTSIYWFLCILWLAV